MAKPDNLRSIPENKCPIMRSRIDDPDKSNLIDDLDKEFQFLYSSLSRQKFLIFYADYRSPESKKVALSILLAPNR